VSFLTLRSGPFGWLIYDFGRFARMPSFGPFNDFPGSHHADVEDVGFHK
jgi:hypothetical protein